MSNLANLMGQCMATALTCNEESSWQIQAMNVRELAAIQNQITYPLLFLNQDAPERRCLLRLDLPTLSQHTASFYSLPVRSVQLTEDEYQLFTKQKNLLNEEELARLKQLDDQVLRRTDWAEAGNLEKVFHIDRYEGQVSLLINLANKISRWQAEAHDDHGQPIELPKRKEEFLQQYRDMFGTRKPTRQHTAPNAAAASQEQTASAAPAIPTQQAEVQDLLEENQELQAENHELREQLRQFFNIPEVSGVQLMQHKGLVTTDQLVQRMGAAVFQLRDELRCQMGVSLIKDAELLGDLLGIPTSEGVVHGADGRVLRDENGKAVMHVGTGQRCQIKFQRGEDGVFKDEEVQNAYDGLSPEQRLAVDAALHEISEFNEKLQTELVRELELEDKQQVSNPTITVFKPIEQQCDMQDPRMGTTPGREDRLITVTALQDRVTMLVQFFSHHSMLAIEQYDKRLPWVDTLFGNITPHISMVRVVLQQGQVLVMHGNTVHAGDKGQPGTYRPCIHHIVSTQFNRVRAPAIV